MTQETRKRRSARVTWAAVFGLGTVAVGVWAAYLGLMLRTPSERCGAGLVALGPRCCAEGQSLGDGHVCLGEPTSCPAGFELTKLGEVVGCARSDERVTIQGGSIVLGPSDWQNQGSVETRTLRVQNFVLDQSEVTERSWQECAESGMCKTRPAREPGLPVVTVSPDEAARYCLYEGGRLPTKDELAFATAGPEARRFPWGPHGLVCRRASYGLESGPCADGGEGPELAGARPDGATPLGVLDLVGNVAEWTREPSGATSVHGGSFRSKLASELTSQSSLPSRPADEVGFRCAYDVKLER